MNTFVRANVSPSKGAFQVNDVIRLDPGTKVSADGETRNTFNSENMTSFDSVSIKDDGDLILETGEGFNNEEIMEIGQTKGAVIYEGGTAKTEVKWYYITTSDGVTYLLPPDGGDFQDITQVQFVAYPNYSGISARDVDANDDVTIACFASGTRIATPSGDAQVETLRVGDLVTTVDNGPQPVRFLWRSRLKLTEITPSRRPVLFRAGSLGSGLPRNDLSISAQHRVLVSGPEIQKMCGCGEALVAAKALTELSGVREKRGIRRVSYTHILLDRHELLMANSALMESFYPGPTIMRDMPERDRAALFRVMPKLHFGVEFAMGPPARQFLRVQEVRRLIRLGRMSLVA